MLESHLARWRRLPTLAGVALVVALAASVWLRLTPILADFPPGDGGLFWVMAVDLRDNGFVPPDHTSFNYGDIPWMYPPIGLYFVALLGGGLDWFRILPTAFAIATLPAMWLLARALTNERAALFAVAAYGLTVSAYYGLLAGGGVTRGPGVVLAMLTMWAVVRNKVAWAGVLGGLVILTHPIAAFYGGLGSAALWTTRGAPPRMLLAPLVSIALGAAWFGPMILRHGPGALLQSAGSRSIDLAENAFTILAAGLNPPNVAYIIGAVGVVVAFRMRRWDLLVWLGVTALGGAVLDRWVVIPLAVLAGLALDAALDRTASMRSVAMFGVATATAITGVLLTNPIQPVSPEDREVMDWAATSTDLDAVFAEVGYPVDGGMVDWFPALSDRRSVTTWQGTEWIAGGYRGQEAEAFIDCRAVECLPPADYYVLRPGCCAELEASMTLVRPRVYRMSASP